MNNFDGETIKNYLLQFKGLPANHLTHALKSMSDKKDGTMTDGIIAIIDELESRYKEREIFVAILALVAESIGTLLVINLKKYFKRKGNKKYEEDQKIIKVFEDEITLAKSDINNIAKESVFNTNNAEI